MTWGTGCQKNFLCMMKKGSAYTGTLFAFWDFSERRLRKKMVGGFWTFRGKWQPDFRKKRKKCKKMVAEKKI